MFSPIIKDSDFVSIETISRSLKGFEKSVANEKKVKNNAKRIKSVFFI